MSAPSKANYSTFASTLRAVREENVSFLRIQAEQRASKALETFGEKNPTEALTKTLRQRFLDKPKVELREREFTAIKLHVETNGGVQTPAVTAVPLLLPQVDWSRDMDIPRSWSSKRMTELMNWRNPDVQAAPGIFRSIINITKRVVTELALPLLTISSVVEAVAKKFLVLGAQALKPISERPLDYVHKNGFQGHTRSALFTSVWTASTLWHNIIQTTLAADERDARKELFNRLF